MNFQKISIAALLLISLTGCFSSGENDAPEPVKLREFTQNDSETAAALAENFAGKFFQSLKTREFSHWKSAMPMRKDQKISDKEFQQMYNELYTSFGNYESSGFLGELTVGDLKNYLWKMRFSREENNKKVVREVVFFVRVYCENGKTPDISGFGVKLF